MGTTFRSKNGVKPVTSVDVAKLAGVSQSTVSRAFSEGTKLSVETLAKVMDAANELGYRPNAIARSLASNRTNIIGLIVMQNGSPFYSILTDLMISTCREYGYSVMIVKQQEGESGTATVARALDYRVDGVAITAIEDSESACEICRQASVPIVLLNRTLSGVDVDSVCCNNYGAGQAIVRYLAEAGHNTLACLMGDPEASTTRDRLAGMEAEAARGHMKLTYIDYGDYTYQSGQEMAKRLVAENPELPDTIFCSGDIIAFGAMDALRYQLGLSVPKDVSVFGFDDTSESCWDGYRLTTMRQPYRELVDSACQLLVSRIEGSEESKIHIMHGCQLVERETVKHSANP